MMADLISRAAAIECAIDAVDDWDGGWNPNRETVIRKYFEEVPAVDAIPVGWLIDRANDPERAPLYRRYAQMLYEEWQKEQEARM